MSVIIIGDKSCVVVDKNNYKIKDDFSFLKFLSSIEDRVICNNKDFFINYEEVPYVNILYRRDFVKNYEKSKLQQLKFFAVKLISHKKPTKVNFVNSLALIENSNTGKLSDECRNIGIIEHFAFTVSSVLNLKLYWLVVSENLIGGFSIIIGYNDGVILYRCIDTLDSIHLEIEKSEHYLSKFGLTEDVIKTRIAFIKSSEIKNTFLNTYEVYNEYGDVYIARRLRPYNTSKPFLVINNKEYLKMKIGQIIRKIFICLVPVVLLLIVIYVQKNYERSSENAKIKNTENIVNKSIEKLDQKINRLIDRSRKQDKTEDFISRDFEDFDNIYSGLKKSYKKLYKELEDLENSINKSRLSVISSQKKFDNSINLGLILPKDVNLISYNYEFSSVNNENKARLSLKLETNDEKNLDKLIINMKKSDKNFKIEKVEKIDANVYEVVFIK